jgi:hypothetical protein
MRRVRIWIVLDLINRLRDSPTLSLIRKDRRKFGVLSIFNNLLKRLNGLSSIKSSDLFSEILILHPQKLDLSFKVENNLFLSIYLKNRFILNIHSPCRIV